MMPLCGKKIIIFSKNVIFFLGCECWKWLKSGLDIVIVLIHASNSNLRRNCVVCDRCINHKLVKEPETYKVVLLFVSQEIFQINRSDFHNRRNVKLLEIFSGFLGYCLSFGDAFRDNFSETRPDLDLFLKVAVFEKTQKYVSDLVIGLSIHDVVPVSVPDFDFFDLGRGLLDAFLKFEEVLVIFLSHWVVADWVNDDFENPQSLSALKEGFGVSFEHGIYAAEVEFSFGHAHVDWDEL